MTDRIEPEASGLHPSPISLRDAVDRWGADLGRWPDAGLAKRGREALLADRSFRAYRDGAIGLDLRLKVAAEALDARIEGGPLERIRAGVLAKAAPRPVRWHRRFAAAAAVVAVAGVLGGASGLVFAPPGEQQRLAGVVQLDPLVFGPSEFGY